MNYLSNSMPEPVSTFDLSPHSNSSLDLDDTHSGGDSSLLYDDDAGKDLFDDFQEEPVKPKKSNGRKGNTPAAADKRATHNAIERARRETLNGRFMTLAEALPSMAKVKRPSKSIIVNKALDFVYEAQIKEHALVKENNELRLQVDQLRARLGMPPLPPPAPLPGCTAGANSKTKTAKEKIQSTATPISAGKIPSPTPSYEDFPSRATTTQQQDEAYSPTAPGMIEQPQKLTQQPSPASDHSVPSPVFAGLPLPSQAPNLNAFHTGVLPSASPTTALSPFQLGGFPTGAQVATPPQTAAGINPSQALLSQQQSLLLAAHLQQQQAMHFENLHQHQQYVNGLNMWNAGAAGAHPAFMPHAHAIAVGNGFGGGGMDSYAYLS